MQVHVQVSYIAQKVVQQEDVVCFELYVKEGCMPPMVLAIATPATHKELLRNYRGLHLLWSIKTDADGRWAAPTKT